jgi:hypothetical protein
MKQEGFLHSNRFKVKAVYLTHLASGVYTVKSESLSKPISVNRIILLK